MRNISADQEEILTLLVEAERCVPKEQRHPFMIVRPYGAPGEALIHQAWKGPKTVFPGDLELLAQAGLINYTSLGGGHRGVYVTPAGFDYYSDLQRSHGEPLERVEAIPLRFISGSWFRQAYSAAHEKWEQAEALLWADDSDKNLSAVGHFAREALQEFAEALLKRLGVPIVEPDKAKVKNRIKAAIDARRPYIATTVRPMLEALVDYWAAVVPLVQRQEHAGQREGAALTAVDAHRVVFHTAVLMYELHHTLEPRALPPNSASTGRPASPSAR